MSAADVVDMPLAGTILGIGWGAPILEAASRVSARLVGDAQRASIFVRVRPDLDYEIRLTVHQALPAGLEAEIKLMVGGKPIKTVRSSDGGRIVLSGNLPTKVVRANGGRLWLQVGCFHPTGETPAGHLSFMRLQITGSHRGLRSLVRSVKEAWTKLPGLNREIRQ
jgi:hypothetical protein